MPGTDAASSTSSGNLRAMVAAALHDLGYFDKFEPENLSNTKLRKRLDLLWQSNQFIESVSMLSCSDHHPVMVNKEAILQIKERQAASPSAAIPTPTSSTECAEQHSTGQKDQDAIMVEELLLDDIETPSSDSQLAILVPFIVQHHVCLAVQGAMEAVCFGVAQKHMPDLLRERRWDCPEAASLPMWLAALNRSPDDPRIPPGLAGDHASARSALKLHEAAVARTPLPYDTLREGVRAALGVVRDLGGGGSEVLAPARSYVQNLCAVARQLRDQMRELEAAARRHRERLRDAMADIEARRAALDRDEAAARQNARDAMAEYEAKWDAEYKAAFAAQETF
ncbi:ubiquinol-cytochrome-c reductase cytochrome c1 [Cordyceps javanica]|uniref:Ubiquinol-cytochrome-c reductase cytochrome c1 n=1 Tax=Cordyceps javanica TaxID=43265 RepID=A0A545WDP5_9HYPO|nr:ubiquinol-cytochrome-c reductase cytochrome c1 [Cordyceps javanica]TQW12109.1 ubiquinol-cytochrome-c reductase cytochrome c1 [Cordyceps javanica]